MSALYLHADGTPYSNDETLYLKISACERRVKLLAHYCFVLTSLVIPLHVILIWAFPLSVYTFKIISSIVMVYAARRLFTPFLQKSWEWQKFALYIYVMSMHILLILANAYIGNEYFWATWLAVEFNLVYICLRQRWLYISDKEIKHARTINSIAKLSGYSGPKVELTSLFVWIRVV